MEEGADSATAAVAAAVPVMNRDPEACRRGKIHKEFMKYDVSHFYGEQDLIEVETWILNMEKMMRTLNIDEWTIKSIVTFLLEHKAHKWWMTIERTHGTNMNWLMFKRLFYEEWFLEPVKDAKIREFLALVQGDM
ncbi:hypothetical protein Syun_014864 [Stephania yunnanensis]|uniref:Retrotransposon gag domain-containing protein n=1 Tax=Stephania yunnanensis TaxID=152371 RepID=A0AAP0PA08_9MAGN